jgi:hypothetical protein
MYTNLANFSSVLVEFWLLKNSKRLQFILALLNFKYIAFWLYCQQKTEKAAPLAATSNTLD